MARPLKLSSLPAGVARKVQISLNAAEKRSRANLSETQALAREAAKPGGDAAHTNRTGKRDKGGLSAKRTTPRKTAREKKAGKIASKPRKVKAAKEQSAQRNLEAEFYAFWRSLGGPELVPQAGFHPTRQWRLDFAHVETEVAIEIHGATWAPKGRHTSGRGFGDDRVKMNAALRLGWAVFELTADHIDDERVAREIIAEIADREQEQKAGLRRRRGSSSPGPFAGVKFETAKQKRQRLEYEMLWRAQKE